MAHGLRWSETDYALYQARRGAAAARVVPATTPAVARVVVPKDRYDSNVERRFAQLLDVWQYECKVTQWWPKPHKGLYLAPKTSYTPDFLVQVSLHTPADELRPYLDHAYRLLMIETKGAYIREKDWIKAKQAAALYTCYRFVLAQWKNETWHWKLIPPL